MTRTQLLSLIIINLVLLPFIQLSYNLLFMTQIAESSFQVFLFPMFIILLNLLLCCCRLKISFYVHWIFIYVGQGTSLACYFVWHYSQLEPFPHMPPGEAAFDLYMVTFLIGLWQLVALFMINISAFVLYLLWQTIQNKDHKKKLYRI
ncbi:hypothetical protein [Lysinibacillus sp. ZYM-1]|uniref:hypothetical protein n=1 Tax=Lysinibacillus sp. ZYM-1 TaxID=1681184 RepID=UPI000AB00073|nr:hypothetical protein [Lysinibacillus sp. ZYM-1]